MRKLLAILFVLLLISPSAAWLLGLDFGININRLGLKFPEPFGRAFLQKEYYRAFDQYFEDSFSMRGPLILAKNWIDLNVFRTTDTQDVHIGQRGWLYSRKSITAYRKADDIKDADMERLMLQLHAIDRIVAASGRRFLFIVAPDKATVYPEFIALAPQFITSGRSQYDLLLERLDRHPLKSYVRLDDVMKAAKRSQSLLYDKAHAHWNGLGALLAAENIYYSIHNDASSPYLLDYISTPDGRVGDLSAQLMGLAVETVQTPIQRLAVLNRSDLPSGILYGDAFRHNLTPYLLQMFNQLDVIQADRIPSFQHREEWLAYDWIMLEVAQTGLQALNIDLDRIYAMLVTGANISRRTKLNLKTAVPVSRSSLHHLSDGLQIKSLGAGSAVELSDVPASSRDIFRVIKLSVATRQSDRMRFQYRSPLREAAIKSIKPGRTDFYLPLPFQKTVSIRIFPGDKAGLIDLHSAEVIEFWDHQEPHSQTLEKMTAADGSSDALDTGTPLSKSNLVRAASKSDDSGNADIANLRARINLPLAHLNDNEANVDYDGTSAGETSYPSSLDYRIRAFDPDVESAAGYPAQTVESTNLTAGPDFHSKDEILPEYFPAQETAPELSSGSEASLNRGPFMEADNAISQGSEVLLAHNRISEANPELLSKPETSNNLLLIVDAEVELSHGAEVLPDHDRVAVADPELRSDLDIPPDYVRNPETGPEGLVDSSIMPDHDLFAASDSDLSKESAILPDQDKIEALDPAFLKAPEVHAVHDLAAKADPEISNESETQAQHDMVAEADSDLSGDSEFLPNQNLLIEDPVPPDSDKKQSHESKEDLTKHEPKSAAVDLMPEIIDAGASAKPDDIVTQPGDTKDIAKVKPIIPDKVPKSDNYPPSITLTDFADGRIFQRKDNLADIMVSGTYTGSAGTIEARVVRANGSEEIVPWATIDDSPQNGIFVGVLAGVPQGGWYNLQVRFGRAKSVSDKGSHKWGVGILVACLGQSNMKEWFHTGESFKAHPMIRIYSDKGWTKAGTRGNGALAFGNRLVESLGIPVGLLEYAVNGSGLRKEADWGTGYWENTAPGSIYSRFVAGVSKVGGALEFVIWFQGEADAARKTVTQTEYRDSLTSFILNQVRADIANGSTREHLPFLIIMLTRRPGGHDEPHQAIRNAQKLVAENVAECYPAATTLDLKNRGKQHMHPGAYTAMGHRVAQTVLYILGKVQYYRGPTATAARQINDRRIDVSIEHRGGGDFKPSNGISGWEILVDDKSRTIAKVKRQDSSTISLILEDPLTEPATVRYLYGATPDTRKPVVDNSALALPLEAYQAQVQ